jgi:hypothetical protein
MTTTLTQLGSYLGAKHKDLTNALATKATPADITSAITSLKGGVPTAGDTLAKLYNLVIGAGGQWSAATVMARDALVVSVGDRVFVADDGDGRWAYYYATTSGANATYVKLSDPDLLNAVLTAAQIAAAYESNAGVNRFTDAEKSKLAGIAAGATANATDAQLRDRATHTGSQAISTVTGLQAALDAKVNTSDLGTEAEFEAAFATASA